MFLQFLKIVKLELRVVSFRVTKYRSISQLNCKNIQGTISKEANCELQKKYFHHICRGRQVYGGNKHQFIDYSSRH